MSIRTVNQFSFPAILMNNINNISCMGLKSPQISVAVLKNDQLLLWTHKILHMFMYILNTLSVSFNFCWSHFLQRAVTSIFNLSLKHGFHYRRLYKEVCIPMYFTITLIMCCSQIYYLLFNNLHRKWRLGALGPVSRTSWKLFWPEKPFEKP